MTKVLDDDLAYEILSVVEEIPLKFQACLVIIRNGETKIRPRKYQGEEKPKDLFENQFTNREVYHEREKLQQSTSI